MRVAVVGSRGMLGRDLCDALSRAGFQVVGLCRPECDVTDFVGARGSLETHSPDLVVNCAAYTEVDRAEVEPPIAFSVNGEGARNLAAICEGACIPLIHISTDYVFDGRASEPYPEDAPAHPLSVYGRSKWEGECAVRSCLREHLIVRTSWLFGVHGRNFVKTIVKLAREREELRVVGDQYGCPTWTADLARAVTRLVGIVGEKRATVPWGTYHFCGAGATTWFGFAQSIVEEAKRGESLRIERIISISTAEYPVRATRPAWSVLDCSKIWSAFCIASDQWRFGLRAMMGQSRLSL